MVSFAVTGARRWIRLPGPAALKAFAADPSPAPDDGELHVVEASGGPLEPLGPGVHTTLAAVLAWTGDTGVPPATPGTAAAIAEVQGSRRSAFSRDLRALLSDAAASGLIGLHQAAALSRATSLALLGTGPAGRRRDDQGTRILGG